MNSSCCRRAECCRSARRIGCQSDSATAKDRIVDPVQPKGRLAATSNGGRSGSRSHAFSANVLTSRTSRPLKTPGFAYGAEPRSGGSAEWNEEQLRRSDLRWHSLRTNARVGSQRTASTFDHQLMLGHERSADAAVPQRDGRGTAERIGSELEKPRPAASTDIKKLTGLFRLPDCPRFFPGLVVKVGCGGVQPAVLAAVERGGVRRVSATASLPCPCSTTRG